MKATHLHNTFRNTLLSTAKINKACLVTNDAVVVKKERLDPHFSVEDELL